MSVKKTQHRKVGQESELEYVEDFGAEVRRAREAMGISQSELAIMAKTKETVIKKIEQGEFNPPIDLARRLEKILKITILQASVEETVKTSPPPVHGLTLEDLLKRQQNK
jgi:putative transcription factor